MTVVVHLTLNHFVSLIRMSEISRNTHVVVSTTVRIAYGDPKANTARKTTCSHIDSTAFMIPIFLALDNETAHRRGTKERTDRIGSWSRTSKGKNTANNNIDHKERVSMHIHLHRYEG
jgi:hypothetical protein